MYDLIANADPIRVMVVDDEPLARERILGLLARERDIHVVGAFETGMRAIEGMAQGDERPELAFVDVQMPELDGLELLEAIHAAERPEIIFVTAYDRYMERAFEVHAVDYLRKPYTDARFGLALDAARNRVRNRRRDVLWDGSPELVAELALASPFDAVLRSVREQRRDAKLVIENRQLGKWDLVPKDTIDWIGADGAGSVSVHADGRAYTWRKTLVEVERMLDENVFVRVHRSYVVNSERIREVKSLTKGEYAITLADGTMLDTGRKYRAAVEVVLRGQ